MKVFLATHVRLVLLTALASFAFLMSVAPAAAQYKPRPINDPATGESWRVEASADFWMPTANMVVASESLGIPGSNIDLKRDLGVTDKRFPSLQVQLRPSRQHKFRFQYSPIKYESAAIVPHDIIFNGIRYRLGVPVNSVLDWKTYRIGYEYDFVSKNRGFVGFIIEAKYTDVSVQLNSPIASESHGARPDPRARRHRPPTWCRISRSRPSSDSSRFPTASTIATTRTIRSGTCPALSTSPTTSA